MIPPALPVFDYAQRLSGGFRLPARMTALPLGARKVALVSPTPIDEATASAIAEVGEVTLLIAPNRLHHMYLAAAKQRYPRAHVLAPAALREKQPALPIDGTLERDLPQALTAAVDVIPIAGAPRLSEYAFFHRAARTLVVTDLVFNVVQPEGIVANIVLFLMGTHGRLATSRAMRALVEDRAATSRSVEQLLALPIETLVMAHGEVVRHDAHARLAEALRWLLPRRLALAAPG